EVTQQNAALVEEAAAASESMQVQAAKLSQLVSSFKLVPGGQTGQMTGRSAQVKSLPAPAKPRKAKAARSAA
ncbi:MAG: chemotaxis protein, partial [Thiobacillus sp.]|nr:chemotaxis protein [Thiobacillus sp.]